MKKHLLTAFMFVALWICGISQAQETLAAIGPNQTTSIEDISATAPILGSGVSPESIDGYNFQVQGWDTSNYNQARDNSDYVEWTVTSGEGFQMIINRIDLSFVANRPNVKIELRSSYDGFSNSLYTANGQNFSPNIVLDTPMTLTGGTVTFRLYFYNFGNQSYNSIKHGSSLTGDFSYGAITIARLYGDVIPTENAQFQERVLASYSPVNATAVAKANATPIIAGGSLNNNSNSNYLGISNFTASNEQEAINREEFLEWTISADENYTLELTGFNLSLEAKGRGGSNVGLSIRTSADAFATSAFNASFKNGQLISGDLTGKDVKVVGDEIVIRAYIYGVRNQWETVSDNGVLNYNPFGDQGISILQLSGYLYSADAESPVTLPTTGGAVQITEIMIDPDNDMYYVELYNPSSSPVDLKNYRLLASEEGFNGKINGTTYIEGNSFFVIGAAGEDYEDYTFGDLILSDLADTITLTGGGSTIDEVSYDFSDPAWPAFETEKALVYVGLSGEDNDNGELWVFSSLSENGATYMGSPGINGVEQFLTPAITDDLIIYDGDWNLLPSILTGGKNAIVLVPGASILTNAELNSLQVRTGASLDVNGVLNLNRSLTVRGDLTFKASLLTNGELGDMTNKGYYGDVTVEAFYSPRRSYSMAVSSVTTSGTIAENWQENHTVANDGSYGTHITGYKGSVGSVGTNGFDATATGNPSAFKVDYPTQSFFAIPNTNIDKLIAGEPYFLFVRGDRTIDLTKNGSYGSTTLRATGRLAIGEQTQTVTPFADPDSDPNTDNYAMFGNPYQATVDLKTVLENSTNVNADFYFVYDATLGSGTTSGGYVTVNLLTNTATGGSAANRYLQPGQGFQVALEDESQTTTIVFQEADKNPGNFAIIRGQEEKTTADNLNIIGNLYLPEGYAQGLSAQDGFIIQFDENFSNEVTRKDAVKPLNFYENIAIEVAGKKLSIESRDLPEAGEMINLFTKGLNAKAYVLDLIVPEFNGLTVVLNDAFTGQSHTLTTGKNAIDVALTSDEASLASDRFSFSFEANSLSAATANLLGTAVYPNPIKGSTINVVSSKLIGQDVNFSVVDLLGRTVIKGEESFEASELTIDTKDMLSQGVYILKIQSGGVTDSHRFIKE